MKIINKIMLFVVTCIMVYSAPTYSFYYNEDPGANMFGNAATGALIGGAVGGGRGAGIGAGVGLGLGAMSSAARSNNRRRYNDDYHYNRDRKSSKSSSRSHKQKMRDLEDENAQLRRQLNSRRETQE